jgi:hypothetical protein
VGRVSGTGVLEWLGRDKGLSMLISFPLNDKHKEALYIFTMFPYTETIALEGHGTRARAMKYGRQKDKHKDLCVAKVVARFG